MMTTDCGANNEMCQNGTCVDLCANVNCTAPADSCDANGNAVQYSGAGTCDPADGSCDYSAVRMTVDCSSNGKVCQSGSCVDLCAGQTCAQPADHCNGNTAVQYTGAGMCDPMNGNCDYSAVETDTDCTNSGLVCDAGQCVPNDSNPTPGSLVITEIMQNPSSVSDSSGEWFEIYNTTNFELDLNGITFHDRGSDSFTISTQQLVSGHSYFVLGNNADSATNGGVTVDYDYGSGMNLANGDDEIVIDNGGTVIDEVDWDDGFSFPDPDGASMQFGGELDPATDDNNNGYNWCEGSSSIGGGDTGTPGADNDVCIASMANVTIYDIQDTTSANHPAVDTGVAVSGVYVTAMVADGSGIWVQEGAGGMYSGVYVRTPGVDVSGLSVGDQVDLTGIYEESGGRTQIGARTVTATAAGPMMAMPEVLHSADLADPSTAEPWEGVLVEIMEPGVTNENPDAASGDFGEFRVDANVRVDDLLYDYDTNLANPTTCDHFDAIVGVLQYSFANYKIEPRGAADMVAYTAGGTTAGAVVVQNFAFTPGTTCVAAGTQVSWNNLDSVAHTATERDPTMVAPNNIPTSPAFDVTLAAMSSGNFTFANAGTFPYRCRYHSQMEGSVIVLEP